MARPDPERATLCRRSGVMAWVVLETFGIPMPGPHGEGTSCEAFTGEASPDRDRSAVGRPDRVKPASIVESMNLRSSSNRIPSDSFLLTGSPSGHVYAGFT